MERSQGFCLDWVSEAIGGRSLGRIGDAGLLSLLDYVRLCS